MRIFSSLTILRTLINPRINQILAYVELEAYCENNLNGKLKNKALRFQLSSYLIRRELESVKYVMIIKILNN